MDCWLMIWICCWKLCVWVRVLFWSVVVWLLVFLLRVVWCNWVIFVCFIFIFIGWFGCSVSCWVIVIRFLLIGCVRRFGVIRLSNCCLVNEVVVDFVEVVVVGVFYLFEGDYFLWYDYCFGLVYLFYG